MSPSASRWNAMYRSSAKPIVFSPRSKPEQPRAGRKAGVQRRDIDNAQSRCPISTRLPAGSRMKKRMSPSAVPSSSMGDAMRRLHGCFCRGKVADQKTDVPPAPGACVRIDADMHLGRWADLEPRSAARLQLFRLFDFRQREDRPVERQTFLLQRLGHRDLDMVDADNPQRQQKPPVSAPFACQSAPRLLARQLLLPL